MLSLACGVAQLSITSAAAGVSESQEQPVTQMTIAPSSPPRETIGRAPLWRLTRDQKVVWLLGGFHALSPAIHWQTQRLVDIVQSVDAVFREAEPATSLWDSFQGGFMMETPSKLRTRIVLPAAYKDRFTSFVDRYRLDKWRAWDLRPQFAANLILNRYLGETRHYHPVGGMDALLQAAAAAGGVLPLEEPLVATKAFAAARPEAELKWLCMILDDLENAAGFFDQLTDAWARGDVASLEQLYRTRAGMVMANALGVREQAIVARSRAWIVRIEKQLRKSDSVLAAIGLDHVLLEDGILEMFKARSFDISLEH
jgi:uncharacterized protein YbaP (TraB family)